MSTRKLLHFCIWTAASYLTLPPHHVNPSLPAIVPTTTLIQSRYHRSTHSQIHTQWLLNATKNNCSTQSPISGKQGTPNLPQNSGMQHHCASVSFETQIYGNNKEIVLKKLSTEIIMGKTTEDTAMELDAEVGASFEQLQDLIKKECDKRDKKYRSLEQKYNKLQDSFDNSQSQKNLHKRGQRGASNKKKLPTVSCQSVPNQRGCPTATKRQPHNICPRSLAERQGKADDINKDTTNDNPIKLKGNRR